MDLKLKNNSSLTTSTLPSAIGGVCTSLYIDTCSNVNQIGVLRACPEFADASSSNDRYLYCDNIGSVSGPLSEIQGYAGCFGFDSDGEKDINSLPRMNGTFTINSWYTTAELNALQGTITGLTIQGDVIHNYDRALDEEDFAVQTLNPNKANYNPAVAIILKQHNIGTVIDNPIISGGGRYFVFKSEVATITTISNWFTGVTRVTDTNAIVTSDNTQSYTFDEFDELGYFTGITSWNGSNGSATFQNCTSLEKVTIPKSLGNAGYTFNGCTSLEEIRLLIPHTVGGFRYTGCSSLTKIYFNTFDDFINSNFGTSVSTNIQGPFDVSQNGHVYINNVELINLVIPSGKNTFPRCSFLKNLESVEFPSSLTIIPEAAFKGCSSITGTLVIPSTVTSIGKDIVLGCNLDVLKIDSNITCSLQAAQTVNFKTDSAFITKGSVNKDTNGSVKLAWGNIIIYGNLSTPNGYPINNSNKPKIFRIKGDYTGSAGGSGLVYDTTAPGGIRLEFIELMGSVNNAYLVYSNNSYMYVNYTRCATGDYWHFGSSSVIPANRINNHVNHWNKTNMVWVGDGSSRANDEAVLALYLADADWSAYPSKLSTWYDYNGEYKWYYVTDNLTNCINTNPDEWPHITRGKSYQTTIEPFEGMTLDSVTVEMYEADNNGTTPNTPTDITSSVYDSSTGEINIPSVTGNIIITASAS